MKSLFQNVLFIESQINKKKKKREKKISVYLKIKRPGVRGGKSKKFKISFSVIDFGDFKN